MQKKVIFRYSLLLFCGIGGDEVKFPCWNSSTRVREHVERTYGKTDVIAFKRLQAEWTVNVTCASVIAAGKTPILWQPSALGPGDPV